MSHLDAGAITTLRDGGLLSAETRRHAESCPVCQRALEEAEDRGDRVARALRGLDPTRAPDVESAKAAVRLRLDRKRAALHRPRPLFSGALGRAAALLLLAAGVVYALPGSPLREWLSDEPVAESAAPRSVAPGAAAEEGIRVPIPESGLSIVLLDVPPAAPIEVIWSDGDDAMLASGPGAGYAISRGRAEARIGAGPIRLELPRSGPRVTVEVDGRAVLSRDYDGTVVDGVVSDRSDARLVFTPGSG